MPLPVKELNLHDNSVNVTKLECVKQQEVQGRMFHVFSVEDVDGVFKEYPMITTDDFNPFDDQRYDHAMLIGTDTYDKLNIDEETFSAFIEEFGTAHLIQQGHIKAS